MYYVKVSNNGAVHVKVFRSDHLRTVWLLSNGFYNASGIWKHLDSRKAGTFENLNTNSVNKNCDKPIGKKSMWDTILKG